MSDAPAVAVEPAAEVITPAVATPPVTVQSPEAIVAAIKAKIHEANPELRGGKKPPAKVDPSRPTEPALTTDPKVLRELGRLQTERTDLKKVVAELEPLKADAEAMRGVKELWGKGDADSKIEALAKLTGKDGLDVLAELVAHFYEKDQEGADPSKPQPTVETKALLAAMEGLKAEVAELRAGKTKTTDDAGKAEAAAATDFAKRFIVANKAKAEISSRDVNVAEAADLLNAAAFAIAERDRIDVKTLTQEAADDLYAKALADVEAEYERLGERFTKATPAVVPGSFNPERYARVLSKPTVTVKAEPLSKDFNERMRQIRERAREKAEAGGYGR
jgi:hypothetical protein